MSRIPLRPACWALAFAVASQPAAAHNESVHQAMTDFAYHVLMASANLADGGPMSPRLRFAMNAAARQDSSLAAFYAAASKARPKLRGLMSGLPVDDTPCGIGSLFSSPQGPVPDWRVPAGLALMEVPMGQLRLPVTVHYGHGAAVCAIDWSYSPPGVLASVNPGSFIERDYTGATLGYWAAAPDKATTDWVLRSTTLEGLQTPGGITATIAATTIAVSAVCMFACVIFPPACAACPVAAGVASGVLVDQITSIDADALESEDFVGFGHFIDMKPTPAQPRFFDEKPAKYGPRAGPAGQPDGTEDLAAMVLDVAGMHVNHARSDAPAHYQIVLGASGGIGTDGHRNTTLRDAPAWETPLVSQLQLTSLDNLAMYGHQRALALAGQPMQAWHLGWPLHALADATVPMHAVGASGQGHRPYEDHVEAVFADLVGSGSTAASVTAVMQVVKRAQAWRKVIAQWQLLQPGIGVPVRDLVTAVAARTRSKAMAQPAVFKPQASLVYILNQDVAMAMYDSPAMKAALSDMLLEGIAAELAYLMSVAEVLP